MTLLLALIAASVYALLELILMVGKKLESWGSNAPTILVVGFAGHSTDIPFGRVMQSKGAQVLRNAFKNSGIDFGSCRFTTLMPFAPPLDQVETLLQPAKGIPAELKPFLKIGTKYLKPEYFKHLAEFQASLAELKPNLIVSLGAEACQLLTGKMLSDVRGTVLPCVYAESTKVLPVFHPSMIFKQAGAEAIFNADLRKVLKESGYPEIRRTRREIVIPECVEDCQDWWREKVIARGIKRVALDIETVPSYRVITCIGFAAGPEHSISIPFYSKARCHYWSPSEELFLLRFLRAALEDSGIEFIMQGGAYDSQWVYEQLGLRCFNYNHDTMLLHHSLFPEMKKGLAFLASIYTDEPSWKSMVKFKKEAGEKTDG